MKIFLDLQGCQTASKFRGIGRYSLLLAEHFIKLAKHHDIWVAFSDLERGAASELYELFLNWLPREHLVVWHTPKKVLANDRDNMLHKQIGECLREEFFAKYKPDIVHISSLFEGYFSEAVSSIGRFRRDFLTAVTFYDLIPLRQSEQYLQDTLFKSWYYEKLKELRRADLWLAISEASKREALEYLALPAHKVINISSAIDSKFKCLDHQFSKDEQTKFLHQYGIIRNFIIAIGPLEARKNITRLILAYAQLKPELRQDSQLVIIASTQVESRAVKDLQQYAYTLGLAQDEVIFLGFLADQEIILLYNLCTAFVFPSFYEGLFFSPLEAMSCGAPVLGFNTSSISEVIGQEEALFDPDDVEDIARKLARVLTDPAWRQELREHGLQQAKKFSWDESARRMLAGLEQLYAEQATQNVQVSFTPALKKSPLSLAYVAPLVPLTTHTSASYHLQLIRELSRYYQVEIITAGYKNDVDWLTSDCPVRTYGQFLQDGYKYDRILYYVEDSSQAKQVVDLLAIYVGTVILADVYFHTLWQAANIYEEALYQAHGYKALADYIVAESPEEQAAKYFTNALFLNQANGIIVNDEFLQTSVLKTYGEDGVKDWFLLPYMADKYLSTKTTKSTTRALLGFKEDDFIVGSFGELGTDNLSQRLLLTWLNSDFKDNPAAYLLFVSSHTANVHLEAFVEIIKTYANPARIKIILVEDFAVYQQYLEVADVAVQLSKSTRGALSAVLIDCFKYGIPTIINKSECLGHIPHDVTYVISENFSQQELLDALKSLSKDALLRQKFSQRAQAYIRDLPSSYMVGEKYYEALEYLAALGPKADLNSCLANLRKLEGEFSNLTAKETAEALALNYPAITKARDKQFFIDVSEMVKRDAQSGVQRVVRNILRELLFNPPKGFRIEPIYVDREGLYRYARNFTLQFLGINGGQLKDEVIESTAGDIYLGLDLPLHLTTIDNNILGDLLAPFRLRGVKLFFMLHDLIALKHPDYFVGEVDKHLENWLAVLARYADGVICVSKTVAEEVKDYFLAGANLAPKKSMKIGWSHHGADIEQDLARVDMAEEAFSQSLSADLAEAARYPLILMVSTIEPRKGYKEALDAFEVLWQKGLQVNLVIVGKEGWLVADLVQRLRTHPLRGKHLFWYEKATDELLKDLYRLAAGLLITSKAEGFGLALIEAARYGIPILARDLAVFREIAGEHITYFIKDTKEELAQSLGAWLIAIEQRKVIKPDKMPFLTWHESTKNLVALIENEQHLQWLT